MSSSLESSITGLITYEGSCDHPHIDPPNEGILINAVDIGYDGDELHFRLLVTLCFSRSFIGAFRKFKFAPVFFLEDAANRRAAAKNIIDPYKRYLAPTYPDCSRLHAKSRKRGFKKQWIDVPLAISVTRAVFHPSIYVTVVLQDYTSNTIAINLRKVSAESYLHGKHYEITKEEDAADG